MLAAEVIAAGSPLERPPLPTGTKGCFGCLTPLVLVSVYGWVSAATGPIVAAGAGLLNFLCCSLAFGVGRNREYRAITCRLNSSVLTGCFSVDVAVSSMLMGAAAKDPANPSWVELLRARRAEALPASRESLLAAVIVVERAMAGAAPLGEPVSLERPSPRAWGIVGSIPLVLGGVWAGLLDTFDLSTIVMTVVGGVSTLLAFEFGRYVEFRDACDRALGLADEAAREDSHAASSRLGNDSPTRGRE